MNEHGIGRVLIEKRPLMKNIDETIAQACAAASRAATILSKKALEMGEIASNVDEDLCSGCRICESLCPYSAIEMDERAEGIRHE